MNQCSISEDVDEVRNRYQNYDPGQKEYLTVIRQLIQHEDNLINHRLTWFGTVQGLLFTTLGVVWNSQDSKVIEINAVIIGIATALLTLHVTRLSHATISKQIEAAGADKCLVIGDSSCRISLLFPWHFLPIIFFLAWISIGGIMLFSICK